MKQSSAHLKVKSMSHHRVTVVIPTFNRPDGLLRAVRSVFAQTLARRDTFALVIVDNTPDATAAVAIETLRAECPDTIRLDAVHAPRPGVANARNAAMIAVKTNLVAYLDDDQEAPEPWLERLLATYEVFPAAVVFGAVVTKLPKDIRDHSAYLSYFFGREPDHQTGYIAKPYGTGNALVDFSKVPEGERYFDPAMNVSGGEDDLFFEQTKKHGGRFAWSSDAPVFEHPERSRLSLQYTMRRAFAYGRAPILTALRATPARHLDVLKWMGVGVFKAVWHGLKWLGLLMLRRKDHAFELDASVRGLGKIFWFIEMKFYGGAALKRQTQSSYPVADQPTRHASSHESMTERASEARLQTLPVALAHTPKET
ncbi:MAG: glycosyltransferase family 2 protein [Pseudomonadota bacterium]